MTETWEQERKQKRIQAEAYLANNRTELINELELNKSVGNHQKIVDLTREYTFDPQIQSYHNQAYKIIKHEERKIRTAEAFSEIKKIRANILKAEEEQEHEQKQQLLENIKEIYTNQLVHIPTYDTDILNITKEIQDISIEKKIADLFNEFNKNRERIIKDFASYNFEYYIDEQEKKFSELEDLINRLSIDNRKLLYKNKVVEIKSLLEEDKKNKTNMILRILPSIPEKEYDKNYNLYSLLKRMNPNTKKYDKKIQYYAQKIEEAELKKYRHEQKFGPLPQRNWTGRYFIEVESYLKEIVHDPSKLEMVSCNTPMYAVNGWLVECRFRASNAFGAVIMKNKWFTIQHSQVIRMFDY